MSTPTFVCWWTAWATLVVVTVTVYGGYLGSSGHPYSTYGAMAVGVTGALVVNLPLALWHRSTRQ